MRKPYVYLILGSLVLAVVLGVVARREQEPEYGGKRLSEWVVMLPPDANPFGQTEAEVALRSIGTNAVPHLLRWIDYEPASWRLKLYEHLGRLLHGGTNELFQDRRMLLACGAAKAIGAFGKASGQVEPILRGMLAETNHGFRSVYVEYALAVSHGPLTPMVFGARRPEAWAFRHGADTVAFIVETNGAPTLIICHTNSIAQPIRSVSRQPGAGE